MAADLAPCPYSGCSPACPLCEGARQVPTEVAVEYGLRVGANPRVLDRVRVAVTLGARRKATRDPA